MFDSKDPNENKWHWTAHQPWPEPMMTFVHWCRYASSGGHFRNMNELLNLRALKCSTLYKKSHLSIYGLGSLYGISKVPFEIPHKISDSYIERCVVYSEVKTYELVYLWSHNHFWNDPQVSVSWSLGNSDQSNVNKDYVGKAENLLEACCYGNHIVVALGGK